jgi:hypothetical protein
VRPRRARKFSCGSTTSLPLGRKSSPQWKRARPLAEAFDKFREKVDRLEEKYFERVMDLTPRSRGSCSIQVRTDYGDYDDERGTYPNPLIAGVSAHLTDGVFRTLLELAEKGAALA